MKLLLFIFFIFPLLASKGADLINEKVVICGVCRDVGDRLPSTINIIENLGSKFKDYKVVVYENNSKDETKEILENWKIANPRVFAITEDVDEKTLDSRIINYKEGKYYKPEEIARARNIVLDVAMSRDYKDYAYVIWLDMDFKIPPDLEGIYELFKGEREWDAVFAYGIDPPGTYWDWYAFRDKEEPLGSESLGNKWWYLPKTFKLSKSDNWHPVYSAFGGCGIYKKSSIEGCRYSALVTKDLESLTKKILLETDKNNKSIRIYYDLLMKTTAFISLGEPKVGMKAIKDPTVGFFISQDPDAPIFRMSSFVYQYPSVCEHVTFHASMIMRGHGKLYIHPRIVFHYGG